MWFDNRSDDSRSRVQSVVIVMTTLVDRILIKMGMLPKPAPAPLLSLSDESRIKRIEDMSNIPRYPPFMEGLPIHSPAALLATQNELTAGVQQLIANPELLEVHYNPSMLRLAEFVQLLPASQSHHHRGAGGMLRHSLEVGFWALQQTEGKLIRGVITSQQRRVIEPRWRLAAFLAGVCHDLGKVVTDLSVTDRAGEQKWRPYQSGLYEWAKSNRVDNYFLHWTDGRGKNHANVSSTLIDAVISKHTFDWIGSGSTDALIWLTESLNNNPGSSNQIHNFVVKADQLSVERDLKSMGAAMAGYEIGVPIERYLTDIMRRLVQEGVWRINEPTARVWNINGTTYLVWPMGGEEIARRTRDEDIAGLPKTPDGILDMMVEREIAFLREDGGGDSFFYIAPDVVTDKIPTMRLKAIRLRDQALISSMPISPIPGKIYSSRADSQNDAGTPVARLTENQPEPDNRSQSGGRTPTERVGESGKDGTHDKHAPGTSVADVKKLNTVTPQLPLVPVGVVGSASVSVVASSAVTPVVQSEEAVVVEKEPLRLESLDGAIGELLRVLIKEMKSGQKSFADLGIRLPDGSVLLKWPDTFAGYGFTPKQILNDLSEVDWLIPASEVAAIGDAEFSGGIAKALRLSSDIGRLFGPGKEKNQPIRPAQEVADLFTSVREGLSSEPSTPVKPVSESAKPPKRKRKSVAETIDQANLVLLEKSTNRPSRSASCTRGMRSKNIVAQHIKDKSIEETS